MYCDKVPYLHRFKRSPAPRCRGTCSAVPVKRGTAQPLRAAIRTLVIHRREPAACWMLTPFVINDF